MQVHTCLKGTVLHRAIIVSSYPDLHCNSYLYLSMFKEKHDRKVLQCIQGLYCLTVIAKIQNLDSLQIKKLKDFSF